MSHDPNQSEPHLSSATPAPAAPAQVALQPGAPAQNAAGGGLVRLFLVSFLGLFMEVACIRWFGSTVVFLTFFTNFVLMAAFLGISVGCLAAGSRRNYIALVMPLALVTMSLALGLLLSHGENKSVNIILQWQKSPQQIYFGTENDQGTYARYAIPIEVIAGGFFVLIGLCFVGVGQETGRAFNAVENRIAAYTVNLLGSLAGIAAFGGLSLLRTPPAVWFAICGLLVVSAIHGRIMRLVSLVASVLLVGGLVATADLPRKANETDETTIWSPYYKIQFEPAGRLLSVNHIPHQTMYEMAKNGSSYVLPYLMNRHAGRPPFDDVLIIGAGSGNDVAAALEQGAKHVDAVEIDPVLYEIGRTYHPDHPAADPRVTYHVDDGRSFVRRTQKKYDLIVYALVDSLVLHSGYSSIRLESFLFTEQAFRDIKSKLKPDGVFVMYNYYRQGWVVGRLAKLAERVFGAGPVVLSVPYRAAITPATGGGLGLSYLIAGSAQSATLQAIESRLHENKFYWTYPEPSVTSLKGGYQLKPPVVAGTIDSLWGKLGPAEVQTEGIGPLPSDDFPFLYLREAMIPGLNLRGILIVLALSAALLFAFAPVRSARPNLQMFFLGAGFMLLETKGVVHMALLFGSTWIVNSIVFAAILVMALLGNVYVQVVKPRRLLPYYVLLVAALALNLAVPMTSYLALPGAWRVVVSCIVVFLPVFFAGVVFATSFRDSEQPNVDFGSNIGGAILGGLSENLSLVVGFSNLLVIAIAYYVLSAVLMRRARA